MTGLVLTPAEAIRPRSALVVVAHADDAEFGVAGTVSQWTRRGTRVSCVVCTRGDRGTADRHLEADALARIRAEEQRAAAAVIGVGEIVFLDYPDGGLQPDQALLRDLVRVIRRFRPDVVVCNDPYRVFFPFVSHRDHRAAGQAALDAAAPMAGLERYFPSLAEEGLAPHRVREVLLIGSQFPDIWVDIRDTYPVKVQALMQHRSQIPDQDTLELMTSQLAADRHPFGPVAEAEPFRRLVIDWESLW